MKVKVFQHKDGPDLGRWRWVRVEGAAVKDDSGVTFDDEISAFRAAEGNRLNDGLEIEVEA